MTHSTQNRYYTAIHGADPKRQGELRRLNNFIAGEWKPSRTAVYRDAFNPSTGEVIAKVPASLPDELNSAVAAAREAFPAWADTPVYKRVSVLFRMKALVDKHLDELVRLLCIEQGKTWNESLGDVLKAQEVIEFACGMPQLLKGESLMNVSSQYDTVQYLEPVGVFLGLAPWNFPAMIPHGWMIPLCLAAGNTFVLKAASAAPQSALRFTELWMEAGLPPGVLNVITCAPDDVSLFIQHPDIVGVSFVGSSETGARVYAEAAAEGKRVQVLGEAKNHALVMADCALERTAAGIINAFCGCAGQRCMALPVVVAEEPVADALVRLLREKAAHLKLGPAYDKNTTLGPLVSASRRKNVLDWIGRGIREGAELVLDGRGISVPGYENGFFIGPTLFDHVTPGMSIGEQEIFGPVLCIKRVRNFYVGRHTGQSVRKLRKAELTSPRTHVPDKQKGSRVLDSGAFFSASAPFQRRVRKLFEKDAHCPHMRKHDFAGFFRLAVADCPNQFFMRIKYMDGKIDIRLQQMFGVKEHAGGEILNENQQRILRGVGHGGVKPDFVFVDLFQFTVA